MHNINDSVSRELREKNDAAKLETLRVLMFRIIDNGLIGADIANEITNLLAAFSVADRHLVCRVSDFIAEGHQAEFEAAIVGADPESFSLLTTYTAVQARVIPWLEVHGYETVGKRWQSANSA
jgi:hypothetical protein